MVRIFAVLAVMALAAWVLIPEEEPVPDRHILFIGNSFTFGGAVPTQVKALAASADPEVHYAVKMIALPGYRLVEHVADGNVLAELQTGDWDVVVLQDASVTAFSTSYRNTFEEVSERLAGPARQAGTEVIYFAHWPPDLQSDAIPRPESVARIEEMYGAAADKTGGRVARVGALWLAAWDAGVTGLYSEDQHHQSVKGAYVSALGILSALEDVDLESATWRPRQVGRGEAERLRTLATAMRGVPPVRSGSGFTPARVTEANREGQPSVLRGGGAWGGENR